MDLWLVITIAVYATGVLIALVGVTLAFFRRNPDGAADIDEWQLLSFTTTALLVSLAWPLLLLGVFVGKLYNDKQKRNPSPIG